MPGSTSTFKLTLACVGICLSVAPMAWADNGSGSGGTGGNGDRTAQPEEDDFSTTPYTTYGEFNEDQKEEEDTTFFQYGRFFGVSLGLGVETIDGNRGALYQGGFPAFDFRLLYWFDFNFALDLGFYYVGHNYNAPLAASGSLAGPHTVNIFEVGVDLKYYFDTKNLSAPISFANPFLMVGVGSYTKNDTPLNNSGNTDSDTEAGFNFGAGLEFTLSPRSAYLDFEGNIRLITFNDTYSQEYNVTGGVPDLTGSFYTFMMKVVFTW